MQADSAFKRGLRAFNRGVLFVLKPLQIAHNYVFLGIAYFLGVGISALFYRMGPGKKKKASEAPGAGPAGGGDTYWRELPPAPRDRASWLRPF